MKVAIYETVRKMAQAAAELAAAELSRRIAAAKNDPAGSIDAAIRDLSEDPAPDSSKG